MLKREKLYVRPRLDFTIEFV